jgi:flagellar protein FliO/FliZ
MYQPGRSSSAALRLTAVFFLAFTLSWRLASTVVGQETGPAEPRRLQPNQQGAVAAPIPQTTSPFDIGPTTPAYFQRTVEEKYGGRQAPATEAADRGPPQSPVSRAGFDSPAKQEHTAPPLQQPSAALPRLAAQNSTTAAPPPLPIARSSLASPASEVDKSDAPTAGDGALGMDSLLTVAGSLGIVMGLFMVTMWCLRRGMPKSARPLPVEVVEVLGRLPLAGRQQMHLIRFGSKLVLAAVSPSGFDAISEITDPVEADRLLGYCEQTRSSSATSSFRGILDRLDERSLRNAEEHGRRPQREYSSLAAHKSARMEDEYA